MNYIDVIIFLIVLFVYIHVNYHLNTSNNLEIYTMDNLLKDKLEEICNIKQPLKFKYTDINTKLFSDKFDSKQFGVNLK